MRIALRVGRTWDQHVGGLGVVTTVVVVSAGTGRLVGNPSFVRDAAALCLCALVVAIGVRSPRHVLYGLAGWLVVLGLLRRIFSHSFAAGSATDPLLLVEPLAILILLVAARDNGAFLARTPLGKAVSVLSLIIVFGALNPKQGSLVAGVSALIFFVPIAAFWIGRTLSDGMFRRVLLIYALSAIPAALYGMYQVLHGFPSWDKDWIARSGYDSLLIGNTVRPFSSFASGSEYGLFLAMAIVIWFVLTRKALRIVSLPAIALLGTAVFYQSSRGTIVSLVGAFALLVAARRGLSLPIAMVCGVALLTLLPSLVKRLEPASYGSGNGTALVQHEVQGLADPFSSQSTASVHLSLFLSGIKSAIHTPEGQGISVITLAGGKYSGTARQSTEADPSNAGIAMGVPGLLAYLVLFVLAIRTTYRLASRLRSPLALGALGLLLITFPQWLNGGQYAVAIIPWLVLGWVDTRATAATDDEPQLQQETEPELPTPSRGVTQGLPAPPVVSMPRALPQPLNVRIAPQPELEASPRRRWSLPLLEQIVDSLRAHDPRRAAELDALLYELRPYANAEEWLPETFDDLIRGAFDAPSLGDSRS